MSKHVLLEYIKQNARKDRTEILDKAEAEEHAIFDESAKTSEGMRNEIYSKVASEANRLREHKYNSVRFRINARRYELKSNAIKDIWRESEDTIRKIEQSDRYKDILESLFSECLDRVPDGSIVRTSPSDVEIIKACIERSKRSLSFEEDPRVHGGVEFLWADGKTVLKNTLSHRLSRLKAEGNAEISGILFSSKEDTVS